jgi:hypothetical protein
MSAIPTTKIATGTITLAFIRAVPLT